MKRFVPWRLVAPMLLCLLVLPELALGQTITSIQVQPSQACTNATVTIRLLGNGSCTDVRVDFDPGGNTSAMSGALPLNYTATFADPGVYRLRAETSDANCTVTAPPLDLTVTGCVVAVQDEDRAITEIIEVEVGLAPAEGVLTSLVPEVTAYYGVIQPGSTTPFLIFGERLPVKGEEATGEVFLGTAVGLVKLIVDEWSTSGTWGAVRVPDWVTGVGDHKALLWARSAAGWESKWLAVDFTAAREVKVLPQADIELMSCGNDANWDCCPGFSEGAPTFSYWGTEEYVGACPEVSGATFTGFHENDWGTVGNDEGTDTYRVSLAHGWVVERIDFDADPSEDGEANAFQASGNSPAGHSTWDEAITWWVTPNDDVLYHAKVFIVGPRDTSHK